MKTRGAVLLLLIGAVIAAIAFVVVSWPDLPARTTPKPPIYLPIADAVDEGTGCIAPMIRELQKRPSWALRVDDMRWTDHQVEPKHASIMIDTSTAQWTSAWIPSQTMPLTERERADVLAAFGLSCEVDESLPRNGFEGRFIAVAYGRTDPATARLPYNSPVVVRLGELFEAIRARYIASRAGAAKDFVLKLSGMKRTGSTGAKDEWTPYTFHIDSTAFVDGVSDENRVDVVDWALALPDSLPTGRMTANGTFTLDGKTKPIATSLEYSAPENHVLDQLHPLTAELRIWMTINRR